MAESRHTNFPGSREDPERQHDRSNTDPAPSGRADVAAGFEGGHWRAPRDYGAQAAAAGQTGAHDRANRASAHTPEPGATDTPHPGAYRYDMRAPQRNLQDGEQLVGGRAYSGIAREVEARSGPRGYRRPDQRILDDLCEALIGTAHLDASEVSVDVKEGTVHLEGSVPERRMKHDIEDIAANVRGVVDVENRIRVLRASGA